MIIQYYIIRLGKKTTPYYYIIYTPTSYIMKINKLVSNTVRVTRCRVFRPSSRRKGAGEDEKQKKKKKNITEVMEETHKNKKLRDLVNRNDGWPRSLLNRKLNSNPVMRDTRYI